MDGGGFYGNRKAGRKRENFEGGNAKAWAQVCLR